MKHSLSLKLGTLTLIAILPLSALAATFLQKEEGELFIANPVDDDVYAAGQKVTVKDTISGDAAIAGQIVNAESVITQDLYAVGQAVRLTGSVGDDAHLAGNIVTVTGNVEGDLFAAGQSLDLMSQTIIGSDAYLAGESIVIAGTVHGTVRAAGNSVVVESTAVIDGNLITYGAQAEIKDGATITGSREHHEGTQTAPAGTRNVLGSWVRSTIALLLLAFLISYFAPKAVRGVLAYVQANPGRSILTGLLWIILVGPIALILAVSLIGLPLALVLFFTSLVVYILATGIAALLIGSWLYGKLSPASSAQQPLAWPAAVLGAAVYEGIQLLGFFGGLLTFILVLFILGATIQSLWQKRSHA
ncbi:MAG: polymer-forming cytoskeletal protein [Candidatus Andersenbacteria bacterium]